jgi:SNF family Na+-dependent transporter
MTCQFTVTITTMIVLPDGMCDGIEASYKVCCCGLVIMLLVRT